MTFLSRRQLEGPKPARVFEVIVPKKLGYFAKIQDVLETLFSADGLARMPEVQEMLAARAGRPGFRSDTFLEHLRLACQGYTMYEADGRWVSRAGTAVDERVLVIRFIFHDRPSLPDADLKAAGFDIVLGLVSRRLAQELTSEEEIWFLEYGSPSLTIWRRSDGPAGDFQI